MCCPCHGACKVSEEEGRFCPVCGMEMYPTGQIRSIHGTAEDVLRVYRELSSPPDSCGTPWVTNQFSDSTAGLVLQIGTVHGDVFLPANEDQPSEAQEEL